MKVKSKEYRKSGKHRADESDVFFFLPPWSRTAVRCVSKKDKAVLDD